MTERCEECKACRVVDATKKLVLAECRPAGPGVNQASVDMWNTVLKDNPCENPRKTLKELAEDALQVQNACNLSGVVHGFSRAITRLREILTEQGMVGTDEVNNHPICRMWASKIHDLSGMGLSDPDRFAEAYEACQALAKKGDK